MMSSSDTMLSLSLSLHKNKGIFALLLGSGVSSSAGIQTGWGIVTDLVRQIAILENVEQATFKRDDELESWYIRRFGNEPGYSELLSRISKHSGAERSKALRPYFEPSEQDRIIGKKIPTDAHQAIAKLVKNGNIRVIITTNFDSLLEDALRTEGVSATVISSPSQIAGAEPLVHSECTVIKVNGDYKQLHTKNIAAELSKYDSKMRNLLAQVFDEFGLIICGWSGEWDVALREALERSKSRRFTIYWASYKGILTKDASKLIKAKRCCEVVDIDCANAFFDELYNKVVSLDKISETHPIDARVARETAKRLLSSESYKIQLRDLMMKEANIAYKKLQNNIYSKPFISYSNEAALQRIANYDSLLVIIQAIFIECCYWGEAYTYPFLQDVLHRVGSLGQEKSSHSIHSSWDDLAMYPALYLVYAGGIAALLNGKHGTMVSLLRKFKLKLKRNRPEVSISSISPLNVYCDSREDFSLLNTLSQHLKKVLRDALKEYAEADGRYEYYFHMFEYLYNVILVSQRIDGSAMAPHVFSIGFTSLDSNRDSRDLLWEEVQQKSDNHPLVLSGLIGDSVDANSLIKAMRSIHTYQRANEFA